MAERTVTYLSAPRSPFQEDEILYVRSQARFYNVFLKDDPFKTLVPACWNCSSEDLIENKAELSFRCSVCNCVQSSIIMQAGRIAEF